ncbi:MAG: hypothetical protein WCV72_01585 [Patescibacteria group bacterium]|jgi:hypothetical protein
MFKPKNGEIDLPNSLEEIAGDRANVGIVYDEAAKEKIREAALARLKTKTKFLADPVVERISTLVANSKNAATFLSNEKLSPGLIADLFGKFNDAKLAMLFSLSPEFTSDFMDLNPEDKIEVLQSSKNPTDFEQLIFDNRPMIRRKPGEGEGEEKTYPLFDPGVEGSN